MTRQQKSAVKRLDKTVLNFADCDQLAPPEADRTPSRSPFVGSWKHKNNTVDVDGFHDTVSRKVRIGPDGRFLLRVKREHGCRKAGLGFVPLTVQGSGDFDLSGSPRFHWGSGTVHCYPRGKGRQVMGRDLSGTWWYDETADILLTSGACWFRAKAGSPSDCKVFWQGLPSPVEDGEAPLGEAAAAGEETTAAPDDGEG